MTLPRLSLAKTTSATSRRVLAEAGPLCSVVIPAYNAEAFIGEALASVFAQDYRPIEVIVVDDASTDKTLDMVRRLAREAPDGVAATAVALDENGGAANALACGFGAAAGEYICWLSADDEYVDRGKLTKQVARMEGGTVDLTYFRGFVSGASREAAAPVVARFFSRFDGIGEYVERHSTLRLFMLLFANPINGSSVMIRARTLMRLQGFDARLGNVDADGDLWMRYSSLGVKFGVLDGCAVFYRLHAGQTSNQVEAMDRGTALTRIRMLRALERTGTLKKALGLGWLLLPLVRRWDMWQPRPLVSAYVAKAISDPANRFGVLARRFARGLLDDLSRAGLLDDALLAESVSSADAAMETPVFRRYLDQLGELR